MPRTRKRKRPMNSEKLSRCRQLVSNQADVSLALARYVSLDEAKQSKNLVLSPLSINVLVSLLAAGASGETLKGLLSYLKSDSIDDLNRLSRDLVSVVLADGSPRGGPKLSVANSIWIQEGLPLKPSFERIVEKSYKASAFQVDFRTKTKEIISQVNSWAEEQTNGLIKGVLRRGSVNKYTRLILANALYFKGEWSEKFDTSTTKEYDFHLLGGNSVKVPFMTSDNSQFIRIFDGFKVLRLPYKNRGDNRQFSMYIFLPNSKGGLHALADKVGSETNFLERHLPHDKVLVNKFRVPRFKFSSDFQALKALENMGAHFANGFTEMVDSSQQVFVAEIFHKAFIEVNEEGTKAAAVAMSGLIAARRCQTKPKPRVDFVADHPFLFVIQEDTTGAVLFFGQVVNPLQE